MLVVVALGGNAQMRRGEAQTATVLRANATVAASAVADLAAQGNRVVVTHGNGPQVGLLALQSAAVGGAAAAFPLDILDAESEGMIGYVLDQELVNALPGTEVVTVLTQIVVDPDDPAFARPTKPIGAVFPSASAAHLQAERGWTLAPDGDGVRRVVASPAPVRVVELPTIRRLADAGVLVICSGGGGIPVTDAGGRLAGVEAVIDKDRAAGLLAAGLGADALLLLTDVDGVYAGWGTDDARRIDRVDAPALRDVSFAEGSMGPKVEAACAFVESSPGRARAGIGRLDQAAAILTSTAGTVVTAGG
jgi:carbamate kinase